MKTKNTIIMFLLFISLSSTAQIAGINYTPYRKGLGMSAGFERFMVGYEKGVYNKKMFGVQEFLSLDKITAHAGVSKYKFKSGDYTIIYTGIGYNFYNGDTEVFINKDRLHKLSIEFGGIVYIGRANPMILFDFLNWEGKFGVIINFNLRKNGANRRTRQRY